MASNSYSNIVQKPAVNFGSNPSLGSSPVSKALGNVSNGLKISNTGVLSAPITGGIFNKVGGARQDLTGPNPSTPLKSTTTKNIDGSSTINEYHAPETGTNKGLLNTQPAKPQSSGLSEQQARNNLTNAGYGANNAQTPQQVDAQEQQNRNISNAPVEVTQPKSVYQTYTENLANTASKPSQQYTDLSGQAQQAYKDAADTNEIIQRSKNNIMNNPNYSLEAATGKAGLIDQNYGLQGQNALTRAQGLGSLANTAISQQGLQQSGQASAAGLAAPQGYGLTTQPFNPVEGTFTGGANSAINRATQAANIGSAQDFTTKINTTQAAADAADANFSVLNSYAQGISSDTPILRGIQQKYGSTIEGNQAVAGFQAQLQNVRSAYQSITGGDPIAAIPDNITPAQLSQVQNALRSTAANNINSYKQGLSGLQGGSSSASTGTSGSGGGLFNW